MLELHKAVFIIMYASEESKGNEKTKEKVH